MINTSRQLKDLIRNLAAQKSADSQLIMREYMTERFLERVSLSSYRDKIILKGGSPRRRAERTKRLSPNAPYKQKKAKHLKIPSA